MNTLSINYIKFHKIVAAATSKHKNLAKLQNYLLNFAKDMYVNGFHSDIEAAIVFDCERCRH